MAGAGQNSAYRIVETVDVNGGRTPPQAHQDDDQRLEPPPGVDPELWDRIPQDVHRRAAQMAQALFHMPPERDDNGKIRQRNTEA